jgi:hypothetical protein
MQQLILGIGTTIWWLTEPHSFVVHKSDNRQLKLHRPARKKARVLQKIARALRPTTKLPIISPLQASKSNPYLQVYNELAEVPGIKCKPVHDQLLLKGLLAQPNTPQTLLRAPRPLV